jgi:hypothetical protein
MVKRVVAERRGLDSVGGDQQKDETTEGLK